MPMKPELTTPPLAGSLNACVAFVHSHLNAGGHLSDKKVCHQLLSLDDTDWSAYKGVKTGEYARHYLHTDARIEVMLLAWGAHAVTKIHDHPRYGCLMRVLQGELKEERYNHELAFTTSKLLKANAISYIDNSLGYHRIKNLSPLPAYSLHIYHPPNHKIREWEG